MKTRHPYLLCPWAEVGAGCRLATLASAIFIIGCPQVFSFPTLKDGTSKLNTHIYCSQPQGFPLQYLLCLARWYRQREKIDWQEQCKFDCQLVRTIFFVV